MKLTKKEVEKVAKEYNLGKLKNFKKIKGGLVNHNYSIKTIKGRYIIRIVGNQSIKKLKHLKLQFKILNFLRKNNFPYNVPYPIKTDTSKEIIIVGGKRIWVYEMLIGTNYSRPNILQLKQMARALAIYHKYIGRIKGKPQKDESTKRILEGFKKMKKIRVNSEADKLALQYRDYFEEIFNKVNKLDYSSNQLFAHGDFDSSNVLFHKGKLHAIIDFDELDYGPRISDVAVSLRDSCYSRGKLCMKKAKMFLNEYEKIVKLSKKEKEMIIPIILYANVDFFVWAYAHMKKEPENKKKYMKEMITLTKDIIKNKKDGKY
jgi:homoserine kinase type II|tara:strand:+ start:221 stop:1174 length:954 start_codon:yes stop_codon:yes gene_type:complete